jgi:ABC-type multidrug transport system ATPase subunit
MEKNKIKCPQCKTHFIIQGKHGEKIEVTCPNCKHKGIFKFPEEKKILPLKNKSFIIEVNNLSKLFNGIKAVDSVSFKIKKGEVFGFLGPNGAGKTTTIKSILGLISTNTGDIKINGIDIKKKEKEFKKYIGYLPEKVSFYNNLTALQNLYFYAEIKNASKVDCKALIEEFGLTESINKKVGKYSKGMIQRLGMARAILGNPPILILDEPSGGLDPRGVVLVRDKIIELKNRGTSIFISSHILSEIQEVCDSVGIIDKGKLVAQDTVSNLSKILKLKPRIILEIEEINDEIIKSVKKMKDIDKLEVKENNIEVVCDPKIKSKIIVTIEKNGGNIINIKTKDPSLEEVFMRFTEE